MEKSDRVWGSEVSTRSQKAAVGVTEKLKGEEMVGRVGFNHQHLKCYSIETTLPFSFSFIVQHRVKMYWDANRFQIQFHAFKFNLFK